VRPARLDSGQTVEARSAAAWREHHSTERADILGRRKPQTAGTVLRDVQPAHLMCSVFDRCTRAKIASTPRLVEKWAYRVRLNGADHQWGKDPPKEVVG